MSTETHERIDALNERFDAMSDKHAIELIKKDLIISSFEIRAWFTGMTLTIILSIGLAVFAVLA